MREELRVVLEQQLNEFHSYCRKKYCTENLAFWKEVQEYKQIPDDIILLLRAKAIYDKYIAPGAALQVNVDQPIVLMIETAINTALVTHATFEEAEASVLLLIESDILPGFLAAEHMKKNESQSQVSGGANDGGGADIKVVSNWNHSSLPTDSSLAKKLGKELTRLDFQKHIVGMDTLKIEEENRRLDEWCQLLEKDSETNKQLIRSLQKKALTLQAETEALKIRQNNLIQCLHQTKVTLQVCQQKLDLDAISSIVATQPATATQ